MDKKLFTHEFIRSLGFTAYRLALSAQLSPAALSTYIYGKAVPSLGNARKICAILNVPIDLVEFPGEKAD